jgi:hypothetical protein
MKQPKRFVVKKKKDFKLWFTHIEFGAVYGALPFVIYLLKPGFLSHAACRGGVVSSVLKSMFSLF